jgi:ribosomal protein L11 methylase PrmA
MKYSNFEPTPLEITKAISNLIKDNVVYDLGSGDGVLGLSFLEYAKTVVGYEIDPLLVAESTRRGLKTKHANYMEEDLSGATCLYVFSSWVGMCSLTHKLINEGWHGIVISLYYPLHLYSDKMLEATSTLTVKIGGDYFPIMVYKL